MNSDSNTISEIIDDNLTRILFMTMMMITTLIVFALAIRLIVLVN